jgi:hypothetical protein
VAKEIRIWQVENESLTEAERAQLDLESRLERWLLDDITVLDEGLLVIGNQVPTSFGGYIDLLCVDRVGDLVIVELKRNKTPREVTAQVLDYASWVVGLSNEEIHQIAAEGHAVADLDSAFVQKFQMELPATLNADHRMIVVGSNIDPSTERIIEYLSSRYGANINAATFQFFQTSSGGELLARAFLLDPAQVEARSGPSRRSRYLTLEELDALAAEAGDDVHQLYTYALAKLNLPMLQRYTTRSSVGFAATIDGGHKSLMSFLPGESSDGGLKYQLYRKRLASLRGTSTQEVQQFLPRDAQSWHFVKGVPDFEGVQGSITSILEIDRLVSALDGPAAMAEPGAARTHTGPNGGGAAS